VGTAKTVTATGLTLSGTDAGNYALTNPTETDSADITPQLVLSGTSASDDLRLMLDSNPLFLDWFVYSGGNPVQIGQLTVADSSGLTINGAGATDTLLLNYANGSPLPATLHLNGTFLINGLSPTPTALANTTLEIGSSTVYFSYSGQSPVAAIRQALAQGYNNGTWTGAPTVSTGAIISTNASTGPAGVYGIGYADSADGIVSGQPINTVEVRFSVLGDANLDRVVNMSDAALLQANYNAANSPAWDLGNFNFDAAIDSLDGILLARNYNLTASGAATAQIVANPSLTSTSSTSTGSATAVLTAGTTTTSSTTTTATSTPVVTATGALPPTSTVTDSTPQTRYPVSVDLRPNGKDDDDRFHRGRDSRRRNSR